MLVHHFQHLDGAGVEEVALELMTLQAKAGTKALLARCALEFQFLSVISPVTLQIPYMREPFLTDTTLVWHLSAVHCPVDK